MATLTSVHWIDDFGPQTVLPTVEVTPSVGDIIAVVFEKTPSEGYDFDDPNWQANLVWIHRNLVVVRRLHRLT